MAELIFIAHTLLTTAGLIAAWGLLNFVLTKALLHLPLWWVSQPDQPPRLAAFIVLSMLRWILAPALALLAVLFHIALVLNWLEHFGSALEEVPLWFIVIVTTAIPLLIATTLLSFAWRNLHFTGHAVSSPILQAVNVEADELSARDAAATLAITHPLSPHEIILYATSAQAVLMTWCLASATPTHVSWETMLFVCTGIILAIAAAALWERFATVRGKALYYMTRPTLTDRQTQLYGHTLAQTGGRWLDIRRNWTRRNEPAGFIVYTATPTLTQPPPHEAHDKTVRAAAASTMLNPTNPTTLEAAATTLNISTYNPTHSQQLELEHAYLSKSSSRMEAQNTMMKLPLRLAVFLSVFLGSALILHHFTTG